VDDYIWLFLLIIGASLFQRFVKAARQKQAPPPSEQGEWEEAEEERTERAVTSFQDLIAEQLGVNLERRPTVQRLPDTVQRFPDTEDVPEFSSTAHAARSQPVARERRDAAALERRAASAREREAAAEREPGAVVARRRAAHVQRAPTAEEHGIRQRREPISLERPRRPEDHVDFERRAVPEPVTARGGLRAKYMKAEPRKAARGRGVRLPDRAGWSAVQMAMVWVEVLGKPKGLE
jgi:hypothetical protein